MIYRLVVLNGPLHGQCVTIDTKPMTLGTAGDCLLVLPDPEAAAHHAVVEHRGEGLLIRDLGSMNRIVVNKREVKSARLRHGDIVEIGRTRLLVRALVQAEVEAAAPDARPSARRWLRVAAPAALAVAAVLVVFGPRETRKEAAANATEATAGVAPPQASAVPDAVALQDLEHLKKDISSLTDTVKDLARRQSAQSSRAPSPAEAALLKAQALIARGELEAADQWLSQIQTVSPEFLPAYEERARLYELRGERPRASEQWAQIIYRSTETPLYQKAVAERLRLSETAPAQAAGGGRLIRIAAIEQNRFQSTEDYDEMRTITIHLAPAAPGSAIDREALKVDVTFYDRDEQLGAITPTAAVTPKEPLQPPTPWNQEGGKLVSASYLVPKGWREKEAAAGRDCSYHGYSVRVYYNNVLQDESALPRNLLAMTGRSSESKVSRVTDPIAPDAPNSL